MDLRVRVLADSDAGMPTQRVAEKYRVSKAWVRRLKQRRRETGEVVAKRGGNKKPTFAETRGEELRAAVAAKPDSTLEELRVALGSTASVPTLSRALARLGLTLKKSR